MSNWAINWQIKFDVEKQKVTLLGKKSHASFAYKMIIFRLSTTIQGKDF